MLRFNRVLFHRNLTTPIIRQVLPMFATCRRRFNITVCYVDLILVSSQYLVTENSSTRQGRFRDSALTMASQDELSKLPSPDMITLLFKCHKSTVALSVLPTKPFAEIKPLLLGALHSRNIKTLPNSDMPLPEDPEVLEFGVLADKKDASKGFVPMEIKEQEVNGPSGTKKRVGGKNSIINQSPHGAGLSDGAWVAFRAKPERKALQVQDDDDMEGTPDIDIEEDPGFDVVLPSFEDEAE